MDLTIEQMRKIVEGAPDDSASHCVFNDGIYFSLEFAAVWNGSWLKCNHRNIRSWEYEYGEDEIISLDYLRTAIADHDRTDHVDFKVGDKVVFDAHFCDEHKGSGYGKITYCTMDKRVFEIDSYYLVSIDEIRHATPEEIAVGHRIDANTDYVTDIRNHISPMTIVIERGEHE